MNKFASVWRPGMMAAATLLISCSGEPSGAADDRSSKEVQALAVCTPEMPISFKSISSAHKITVRFSQPFLAPMFLFQATITEVTSMSGVAGIIHPGTDATHGGTAALQVSSAIYAELADFMSNHSGLLLEICYDDLTLVPSGVTAGATQP